MRIGQAANEQQSWQSPNEPDAREQLARLVLFLKRALGFWRVLLVSVILGCLSCAGFLYLHAPRYRSETVIFYSEKGGSTEDSEAGTARTVTLRLKELLLSRASLTHIIADFDPYPDIRQKVGLSEAIEELKKHIEFKAPGGDTISIAFEGSSPEQAQRVTAALARSVIDKDSELRQTQARAAQDFLKGQGQSSETELRDAEQKLAAFMAQHPRFALDATPLTSGAAIRATLGAPAPGGATAPPRISSDYAAAPSAPPAAGATPRPVGGAADPHNVEALARAEVAAARQNLSEQLLRYTPAHPDVRAAQAALDRANERLKAAQSSGPAEPAIGAEAAAAPAPVVARSVPVVHAPLPLPASTANPGQAKELIELETQWLTLTRAVTEARQRQDQLEEQLFKADIQASSEGAGHGVQVDIIDPAFLPQRALPPGRSLVALLFFAGSLLLGVMVALICAAFDDRIRDARDLDEAEILSEIPRLSTKWSHRVA
jgi:capsular polysaccharide biosynthesis protein